MLTLEQINNSLFQQLPGVIFIKNTESIYASANSYTSYLYGFKDADHLCGHSDYDIKSPAVDSADDFRNEDKKVLTTGKSISSLHINTYINNEVHIFSVKKTPIRDQQNQIIGIGCVADEISNPDLGKAIFQLANFGKLKNKNSKINLQIDDHDIFTKLSLRETELLFYFVRGLSDKQISLIMGLSPRTIESYMESIKNKLQCDSRNDLIVLCLSRGLANTIPSVILKQCLKKNILF